jgi:hypothetical protein
MLDGAPTLFHRPMFCDYIKRRIKEGTLQNDVRGLILPSDSLTHRFDG